MDKDEIFLDALDDRVFQAWNDGEITNELRNQLIYALTNVRDYL